jgi:ubiquinone/menaquinone biosynthesis C-methylase UbiE
VVRSAVGLPTYRWDFYQTPERLREFRKRAYQRFLQDFRANPARYVAGRLPTLPFPAGQFALTLCSYLLFVYEDHLDYQLHKNSLREMMRVTKGEARFYPIVTFEAVRSSYIERLKSDPDLRSFKFEIVPTDFEFLLNSNFYLSVTHR